MPVLGHPADSYILEIEHADVLAAPYPSTSVAIHGVRGWVDHPWSHVRTWPGQTARFLSSQAFFVVRASPLNFGAMHRTRCQAAAAQQWLGNSGSMEPVIRVGTLTWWGS